jgi:RND family efflux transporter MFP subunit
VADPVTQTFNVRVAMESPQAIRALPGMSATVRFEYRRAAVLGDRIMIPADAVAQRSGGEQVAWILADDGKVSSRPVQLGSASGGSIEVLSGLNAGDRIVIAGVRFLRDGMTVRDLGNELGDRS